MLVSKGGPQKERSSKKRADMNQRVESGRVLGFSVNPSGVFDEWAKRASELGSGTDGFIGGSGNCCRRVDT